MTTTSYRFAPGEPLDDGLRRVAREEIDAAIIEATDPDLDHPAAIHQARKRCKRIRALLGLYRGTLSGRSRESARFRDLAGTLAPLRDADSLREAFRGLLEATNVREAPMGEMLTLRRDRIAASAADPATLRETVAEEMRRARPRVESWSLPEDGWTAIERGFRREIRRARDAFDHFGVDASGEQVHDLRKATKGHWYHTRLLRDVWPRRFGARQASLKTLADLLGEDHDLGILLALATGPGLDEAPGLDGAPELDGSLIAELSSAIASRQSALRGRAQPMAEELYERDTDSFASEVERRWQARRSL